MQDADSVTIEPRIGDVPLSLQSISVSPDVDTTYTLTAAQGTDSVTAEVTVTVSGELP